MRGSKWDLIKPLLKTLQEAFPAEIHVALIIKPDNFWQKQKTNFGSSKFIFEVREAEPLSKSFLLLCAVGTFLTFLPCLPCNGQDMKGKNMQIPWPA